MIITPAVQEAFQSFRSDPTQFALPLQLSSEELHPLPTTSHSKDEGANFQLSLSKLDSLINTKTPLYLIIRRNEILTAVTYTPYLADAALNQLYLSNRQTLIQELGESNFSVSIICKEPGDITDARSWEERDTYTASTRPYNVHNTECKTCPNSEEAQPQLKDLGHKKTKCRLCDRRMKPNITPDAIAALQNLRNRGDCVQLTLDLTIETLTLVHNGPIPSPSDVSSHIPASHPSFTFYIHPSTAKTYFIYFSPDSAPVKSRMMHTMAIAGLVNVIAKEAGVHVDQKIEIHDVDDLKFEEGTDERIGRFRSMYLLNERKGTESVWEGMPEA